MDTALHPAPDTPGVQLVSTWEGGRAARPDAVWVVRFLEERDGWSRIGLADVRLAGAVCHTPLYSAPLRLALWVRSEDLVPVLDAHVRKTGGDQTLELMAGLAVPRQGGARVARQGDVSIRVKLPDDVVSTTYVALAEPYWRDVTHRLDEDVEIGIHGAFQLVAPRGQSLVQTDGGVVLKANCAAIKLDSPRRRGAAPLALTPPTRVHAPHSWTVAEGASVRIGTSPVGDVGQWGRVLGGVAGHQAGATCIDWRPRLDGIEGLEPTEQALRICIPSDHVIPRPPQDLYPGLRTVRRVAPRYPKSAQGGAHCAADLIVKPSGAVKVLEVYACEEPFRKATRRAVRRWRYEEVRDGVGITTISVRFQSP